MRLLAISDIHSHGVNVSLLVESLQTTSYDYVLVSGDITNFGSVEEAYNLLKYFRRIAPVYFVPGNCDPADLLHKSWDEEGIYNVHSRTLSLNSNWRIIGVGGSTITPFKTNIEFDEEELMEILKNSITMAEGNLILLSHSPPYNSRVDRTFTGLHVGSRSVKMFIERYKPKLVVSGHIHEARGYDRIGETLVLNPGPLRKGFYATITIRPDSSIDFDLLRL